MLYNSNFNFYVIYIHVRTCTVLLVLLLFEHHTAFIPCEGYSIVCVVCVCVCVRERECVCVCDVCVCRPVGYFVHGGFFSTKSGPFDPHNHIYCAFLSIIFSNIKSCYVTIMHISGRQGHSSIVDLMFGNVKIIILK